MHQSKISSPVAKFSQVFELKMWQKVDATDRVYEEVLSVVVRVARPDGNNEILSQIFIAPATIVRAFAEFLSQRNEDETFDVKQCRVRFADVLVSCGDSNQAVHAFECFQHYNMPLGNYEICDELIKDSDQNDPDHDSRSSHSAEDNLDWVCDKNFQRFKCWYKQTRGNGSGPDTESTTAAASH